MRLTNPIMLAATLCCLAVCTSQGLAQGDRTRTFDEAAVSLVRQLEEASAELTQLREAMTPEKIKLGSELSALEEQLRSLRAEFQDSSRRETVEDIRIAGLESEIKNAEARSTFLRGNLDDFRRKTGARLHIAEMRRYSELLERARSAAENPSLTESEVYEAQLAVLDAAMTRLDEGVGGSLLKGRAVDLNGIVTEGVFALIGPAAIFRSNDGLDVGLAEERLNPLEPTIARFADEEQVEIAKAVVETGRGSFPLDPTLGDASKIAETNETFLEHVQKGGMVMIPIFAMAFLALVVAIWKWLSLSFVKRASRKQVAELIQAVESRDEENAQHKARAIGGPIGRMLSAGVENLRQPRELIEEVMYEVVLKTRLKVQSMLPFIAICAASAPLLGLLGTVTGIINTFKLLTIFGSGDVGSLSGGISEALITTKFGLLVAIPSLLLHAYLTRKAKRLVGEMETTGIEFINQVSKTPLDPEPKRSRQAHDEVAAPVAIDAALVREQVQEILGDLLGPLTAQQDRPEVIVPDEDFAFQDPPQLR